MSPQKHFKLNSQALLMATIAAAFPLTGYCVTAGRVDFVVGNVEAVAADGRRNPLSKGAEINVGESISTAAGGRAQIRFADGGFISLQPNTTFRVDEFNYKGRTDGEEKGFFSLLKGGMRAITGAIGHVNRNTYQVRTPAATLGIRGTGYNMALRDDGLFVNVGEGAISLNNNAGLLVVTAGGAAFVANINTAPAPTNEPPHTPPRGLQEPTFTVADKRDTTGSLALISLTSGPGYEMAYASTAGTIGSSGQLGAVTADFSGSSQLIQYSNLGVNGGLQTGSIGAAVVAFSATDGIIGWGRWVGTTTGTAPPNPLTNGVFDYVIGIPTAAMPTTGTATYSLMGYTSPTATNGTTGYTVSGTLTANFAPVAAAPNVVVNMTVGNGATNTFTINGPATITGATFSSPFTATTNTNFNNCSGCTTSINGFFAGTNASRAGLSYSIVNTGPFANSVQGVAVFSKN